MPLLIVDDNVYFLEAARALLQREGMTVAGVASTAADAAQQAVDLQPDVVLVDVDLGDDSGFDLARVLTSAMQPRPPSVVLISASPREDFEDLIDASPALGFIKKADLSRRAISAIVDRRAGGPSGTRGM